MVIVTITPAWKAGITSFKVEAIHGEKFSTRAYAKNHVFDYIDVYYNRKCLHSKLGYLSPVRFEEQMVA